MKKDKTVLKQVKSLMSQFDSQKQSKSVRDGHVGTAIARKRVREKITGDFEKQENDIKELIKKQTDAIHATNIERLLTKKWSEYPNSFHIQSKIHKFSKNEDRVNNLMNWTRYTPG